jgi:hypothetical protein
MCERLIGLAVGGCSASSMWSEAIVVVIEQRVARPNCSGCGGVAAVKERPARTSSARSASCKAQIR